MAIKLMFVASDEKSAHQAQTAGVDRVFFDMEYINKAERQRGRNTLILHNSIEQLPPIRAVLNKSKLLVRVNALYHGSKEEIDTAIAYGADIIMLPMVFDAEDVQLLVQYVGGRAKVIPMIETSQALVRVDDILSVKGVDEIYIGLNDLHISMGLTFMFELLSGGIVDYIAKKAEKKGIPFGFGGMAKIGEGALPAECILAEHYRLHSSSVILSRTFRNEVDANGKPKLNLKNEITRIRKAEAELLKWSSVEFEQNRRNVCETVRKIVSQN